MYHVSRKRGGKVIITGIIAEFNPLHQGHESLLRFAQSLPDSEGVIVILSSNFTQRGSPSVADKFARAYTAVMAGADVVIELPFMCACSAGQDFARGAVNILGRLGCVSRIAFGMENPEFDAETLAGILADEPGAYREILRREIGRGASFPKAVSIALEEIFPGAGDFITRPNNMLAVSYMAGIIRGGYDIEAVPFRRIDGASSRAIRGNLAGNAHMMPGYSREILAEAERSGRLSDEGRLWPLLQGIFIRSGAEDLRGIYGVVEGIEGLFLKHWRKSSGLEDFTGRCVCARYTRSHIRRRLIYILLGLRRGVCVKGEVPYARVLAFTEKGRGILRMCREVSRIPVITRLKDAEGETGKFFAETEYKASQLYELTLS
ncbi:MAG: nucleotidyltransferase family protein, partial [Synergistaceae bacterium]|nr:nucleotidyltransferase family protein [Synergistaceae bacterium]